jgi:hypothetical protein
VNRTPKFNLSWTTAKGVAFLTIALQFIKDQNNVNMMLRITFGPKRGEIKEG